MRHAKFKNVFCRFRSFEMIPGYIFECTSLQKLPLMPPLFDSYILLPSFAVSRINKEAGSSLFPSLNDNEEEIQNMAVACDRFFLFPFFLWERRLTNLFKRANMLPISPSDLIIQWYTPYVCCLYLGAWHVLISMCLSRVSINVFSTCLY